MKKSLLSLTAILALGVNAFGADEAKADVEKRTLKGNMMEVYNVTPGATDSVLGMITDGEFYGRLRVNNFTWDWNADDTKDHTITGIGGSLLYKTASLSGFSLTGGLYYTYAFSDLDLSDATVLNNLKAGKDTLSRYNAVNGEGSSMLVPAQYYAEYKIGKTDIKAGQMIYESLFTKSNDTKMIPNTFMGLAVENKDVDKTTIRAAYFMSQKLRDHTTSHDFVTFKTDDDGTTNFKWNNNDDSAVNKSLTYAALDAAGMSTSHQMINGDVNTKMIDNLNLTFSGNYITEIVAQAALEANYKMDVAGMTLKPGFRYIYQQDMIADNDTLAAQTSGKGIANLGGNANGYTSPNSLTGQLYAARLVAQVMKGVQLMYGWSYIADQADIMAMWRGFPTGGYTRAMAQYNWYANTTTNMLEAKINLGKLGAVPGMNVTVRYAMQDFDENKSNVQGDTNITHIDIAQNLNVITKGLSAKIRLGLVTDARSGTLEEAKSDASYNEYRFEANYLF